MLTDSRSFLSYPRHEYFRRILCNLIGKDVEKGLLPASEIDFLGKMVENISYHNAKNYLIFNNRHKMKLEKYSFGVGDRFMHQGKAQLKAIMKANEQGLHLTPVWNKSNREHTYVGSEPADTRKEADEAVKALNFKGSYFVDADHINLNTVAKYVTVSDFSRSMWLPLSGRRAAKRRWMPL